MKTFLALVIAGGLGALFYHQKHQEPAAASAQTKPAPPAQKVAAGTQPGQPSEHNWMKRSLDRASDVRNQSRAQTQQSQDP